MENHHPNQRTKNVVWLQKLCLCSLCMFKRITGGYPSIAITEAQNQSTAGNLAAAPWSKRCGGRFNKVPGRQSSRKAMMLGLSSSPLIPGQLRTKKTENYRENSWKWWSTGRPMGNWSDSVAKAHFQTANASVVVHQWPNLVTREGPAAGSTLLPAEVWSAQPSVQNTSSATGKYSTKRGKKMMRSKHVPKTECVFNRMYNLKQGIRNKFAAKIKHQRMSGLNRYSM